jgi:hypothetical protein
MKIRSIAFAATLAAVAAWPTLLSAESPSRDRQTITPAFKETIPNIPGKSLVGLSSPIHPAAQRRRIPIHVPPSLPATCSQARSEARSIMARRRYSTRANTGPSRPGPIIPSARTRAPLNLQVCLLSSSSTPPMPTGWSHMNRNETAARPAASVQQPAGEGCMRSLEFGRIPLPAGGQNGARLPANVRIWPHTDESQRASTRWLLAGTPEIANVCRHRAKQIGVGRGLCQEACHG